MISDYFDRTKHSFGPAAPCRSKTYYDFLERTEKFDDGTMLLFQVHNGWKRWFITFCVGNRELGYISMNNDVNDIAFHISADDESGDEDRTITALFAAIESASPHFVEWFVWNVVGIETKES